MSINLFSSRLGNLCLSFNPSKYYGFTVSFNFLANPLIDSSGSFVFFLAMVDVLELQYGCPAYIEGVGTSYGYIPSLGAGIAFCTLFGLSLIIHTIQFIWKRQWWASVFSVGCLGKAYDI